jgi:lipopolysaccharide export system permease protein
MSRARIARTPAALLSRLDRYLAARIALPLFATVIVSAMLLVLDRMLRLFDFVIREGGPMSVVWKMLANLLPEYLGLGIPIGLMLGILLAFRRLALSSELDAMRGAGVSWARLLRVPYLWALAAALVNLAIVGFVQPLARYAFEELRYELRSGALGASVQVGEFTRLGPRATLRVEASEDGGARLSGLFLRTEDRSGQSFVVTAARGRFLATDNPDVILLALEDGVLVQDAPGLAAPRVLRFSRHNLPIDLPAMSAFRARGERELEMTLPELVRVGGDAAAPPASRNQSIATSQRRLIQVAVMAVLPLLAVALAVPPKRSASALGILVAIILLVGYHKLSEWAERVGGAGRIDPFWSQWLPFLLFAALCVRLFWVLAAKPGGQPIGGLERLARRLGEALARLRPRGPRILPDPAEAAAPAGTR